MDAIIAVIKENVKGDQIAALVLAALILLATAVISHVITRLIRRILRVDGIPLSESSILVNIGRACVWVVGVSIMLSGCFGVDVNAVSVQAISDFAAVLAAASAEAESDGGASSGE